MHWPGEATRLSELRAVGLPRLLLVDGAQPPVLVDCLEDWVRAPGEEAEIRARVHTLRSRAVAHSSDRPVLDEDGVVRLGDRTATLPPVETRLMAAMVERFGLVTHRETLVRVAWPGQAPARNSLDVHVLRLRRRLAPLGLEIRTVRSRGYLLDLAPDGS